MDLKATIDKDTFGYRNRLLLIAAGALLYAAWCLYDGMIAYPDQIEAYTQFAELRQEHPDDWRSRWETLAKENGWDHTKEPDERTQGDITTQWLLFSIVFPIGAYCLFAVGTWSRRYLGADETTLYANGGIQLPFDQITRIDASRWENKGIARVYYESNAGEQSILVDDFKLERQATDEIFARVCSAVDDDKIDGLSQADPDDDADPADLGEAQAEAEESEESEEAEEVRPS